MDPSFLADLQELEDSEPIEEQELPPTSKSNLLNNPQFMVHVAHIESITNPKEELHSIQKTNAYIVSIDRQISSITKFVKDIYKKRYPEIESAVVNHAQYVRTVMAIEKAEDKVTQKDLSFLSPHQALSITITISSFHEHLNSKDSLQLHTSCSDVLRLCEIKDQFFRFVESCISSVCPNLCNLVGTTVASKLVTSAGGIAELSNTPACNIQLLGGERGPELGFGMMTRNHTGVFGSMEMVQKTPNEFQMELVRMFANKAAIAARIDKLGVCPSGFQGDKLRQALLERFQKIQQKGLAATLKPLPIPGQQPKKKRGGKRYRRQKQLMGISQIGKLQNRMEFGKVEEQTIQGVGKGMIKSSGHIRGKIKKGQKLNPSKKIIAQLKKDRQAGLQSTLNFDATHQMELVNPDRSFQQKGTETYFNKESGFKTVLQDKLKKL